jgi:microcystin degradation protein MlrC
MNSKTFRIAVGQISSESNHFVTSPCELNFFRNTGYLLEGDELFKLQGARTEVSGMLATFDEAGDVEVVPLLAARANSSGLLSESCYGYLKENLLNHLKAAGRIDGVILSHHGSMVAVSEDDPEGDVGMAVRQIVGPSVPIVMTLDLHANVTRRMVKAVDSILGYEHYPHDDVYTTGVRGAVLLLKAVRGAARPVMGFAQLPMLLTGFNASTACDTPYALLMQEAKALEREPGILSTSVFLVGSYIDVHEMGCSALVITDDDTELALKHARKLAERFWARRHEFQIETMGVAEAVKRGRQIQGGPVLLLDTADTTGGGASGDGVGLIKGLLELGVTEPCLAMVVDPEAAQICIKAGVGSEVSVFLGHKLDPIWGQPIHVMGKVKRISNGRFQYTGGILGGTWATMGPSVVLEVGSIEVLISTYPTYDWADEQYRCVGMQPEEAKFVGVKNIGNFRFAYRNIMKGFFVLDVPGPTPPDMRSLPFKMVPRPVFPLDEDFGNPEIRLSTSESGKGMRSSSR